ncbi:hypothetical protein PAMP_015675 [Pampus punctatissimus]
MNPLLSACLGIVSEYIYHLAVFYGQSQSNFPGTKMSVKIAGCRKERLPHASVAKVKNDWRKEQGGARLSESFKSVAPGFERLHSLPKSQRKTEEWYRKRRKMDQERWRERLKRWETVLQLSCQHLKPDECRHSSHVSPSLKLGWALTVINHSFIRSYTRMARSWQVKALTLSLADHDINSIGVLLPVWP